MRKAWLCVAMLACSAGVIGAESPRGSITIERIAAIKYPTNPAWSPDGRLVAFLWDSAGKQDLFVVAPGPAADGADRLRARSGSIAVRHWCVRVDLSDRDPVCQGWTTLDGVARRAEAVPRVSVRGGGELRAVARPEDDRVRSTGRDLGRIARGENGAAGHRSRAASTVSTPVFSADGRWLAFTLGHASLEPEQLPWNGDRVRSVREHRHDRSTPRGRVGGRRRIPGGFRRLAMSAAFSSTADGSLILARRCRPTAKRGTSSRRRSARCHAASGEITTSGGCRRPARDAKLLVSPDGKSIAFVSDRTGWIHVYVMPADANSESQARQLTSGNYLAGPWQLVARQPAHCLSPQRGGQPDASDSSTSSTWRSGRSEPIVKPSMGSTFDPSFSPDGASLVFHRTDVENSLDLYVAPARAIANRSV